MNNKRKQRGLRDTKVRGQKADGRKQKQQSGLRRRKVKLPTPVCRQAGLPSAGRQRAGLPGNVDMITGSAFLRAYSAKAGRGVRPTCP